MRQFFKSHWDAIIGASGFLATLTMQGAIAYCIGFGTLIFVCCKAFIWLLKARMAWRNRNNTSFWVKKADDEETET